MSAVAYLRPPSKPVQLAPIARFRVHPRINLERCAACNGVGFTVVVRRWMALQRPCMTCDGRGTIVRDDT